MSDKSVGLLVIIMAVSVVGTFIMTVVQGAQLDRILKEEQSEPAALTCAVSREYRWYGAVKTEETSCGTH